MAHYPSDVLFALLIGVFSGFVAAFITQLIFRFLENHSGEGRVYDFLLDTGFESISDIKSLAGSAREKAAKSDALKASAHQAASKRHAHAVTSSRSIRRSSSESSSGSYQGKH